MFRALTLLPRFDPTSALLSVGMQAETSSLLVLTFKSMDLIMSLYDCHGLHDH